MSWDIANWKIFLLILTSLIFFISISQGAVIHGKIYSWEDFSILPNTVVTINTTPEQRVVSDDGSYSFNVSLGNYRIEAFYYINGELKYYASENITVRTEGSYNIDLLLFPVLPEINNSLGEINFEVSVEERNYILYPIFIAIAILIFAYFKLRIRKRDVKKDVPEDLKMLVEEIKKAGGRVTQKELRERLKISEAKLSLMLADLERRGVIEKVKKGRGNIIFLK